MSTPLFSYITTLAILVKYNSENKSYIVIRRCRSSFAGTHRTNFTKLSQRIYARNLSRAYTLVITIGLTSHPSKEISSEAIISISKFSWSSQHNVSYKDLNIFFLSHSSHSANFKYSKKMLYKKGRNFNWQRRKEINDWI